MVNKYRASNGDLQTKAKAHGSQTARQNCTGNRMIVFVTFSVLPESVLVATEIQAARSVEV